MSETQVKKSQCPGYEKRAEDVDALKLEDRMSRIGRKILVLSGKGGVGKSTVAANLAAALARTGKKVGLLDIDIHGPSVPTLFGLKGHPLQGDQETIFPVRVNDNLSVMSIGFMMPELTDAAIMRGPMKHKVIEQFLREVHWGTLDYLIVDSPPGTGDEPLSVAQLAGPSSEALIVTTPQDLAISDVRRCVTFCQTLSLPILGIVENMSGFVCPKCGERTDLFGVGGGEALAKQVQAPFLGRIPIDPSVMLSGDAGSPFVESQTQSPAGSALSEIVSKIQDAGSQNGQADEAGKNQKENKQMKIAIPLAEGRLAMHFGHCERFAILEVDEQAKTIQNTIELEPPPHEPGLLPRWLHEQGANVIIAGGMGKRAQDLFVQNEIKVVVGAPSESPEQLAAAYLAGTLKTGDNVCDH
jgi:ATP-binding protein involved in chromosome partitioning